MGFSVGHCKTPKQAAVRSTCPAPAPHAQVHGVHAVLPLISSNQDGESGGWGAGPRNHGAAGGLDLCSAWPGTRVQPCDREAAVQQLGWTAQGATKVGWRGLGRGLRTPVLSAQRAGPPPAAVLGEFRIPCLGP